MSRKKHDPSFSLNRFMLGIYDHYHDRGMPPNTAKARMIDSTLETCTKMIRNEKDIPDQMLVILSQYMSRALNSRGVQLTKEITSKYPNGVQVPEEVLVPLRQVKETKDAIDKFIKKYQGWNETDGKKRD